MLIKEDKFYLKGWRFRAQENLLIKDDKFYHKGWRFRSDSQE